MSRSLPPALPTDPLTGSFHPVVGGVLRPAQERRPAGLTESAAPPGLRRAITPAAAMAALRRHWLVALPLALVFGAAAAAAVWELRPDKYTSFALLRVSSSAPQILQTSEGPRQQDGQYYTRTQLALIKSRPVLRAALKNEKVRLLPIVQKQPDQIEWLERELVAEQITNTEVVRVSLTARGGGADLATVVNAVVAAYMADVVEKERAIQMSHLSELQVVYKAAEDNLRELRKRVTDLSRDLKSGNSQILTLRQQRLLDEYTSLKRELGSVKNRCRDLDLKIAAYSARLAPAVAPGGLVPREEPAGTGVLGALVERELDTDPQVALAEAQAAKARDQLRQFELLSSNPKSAAREELKNQSDAAAAAAAAVRAERRSVVAARHADLSAASVRQELRGSEVERKILGDQANGLQREVDDLGHEIDELGLNSVELELKRNEIDRSEQFLRTIWDQKERLAAELNPAQSSPRQRVSTVSGAEDGAVLNKWGRYQEALGGGLAGAALVLLAVAVLDLRRNRIHSPNDVSQGLRLRVLGALPDVSTGAGSAARRGGRNGTAALESINGLRSALARGAGPGDRGRVLMVASASPREGKTTLATQLASSFARARRKTLLIDCDLRSPSLHRLFGLAHAPGVCEVLSGGAELDAAIRPSGADNLDLLPAGQFCPDAEAGLAHRTRVQDLIDAARSRYEVIVIDSSPVLLVPDALMVGECVDGLLLSVRSGVSRAAAVHAGYERLTDSNLPVLGVVVHGVPESDAYARGYGQSAEPAAAAV